jgi:hypothetical protein
LIQEPEVDQNNIPSPLAGERARVRGVIEKSVMSVYEVGKFL